MRALEQLRAALNVMATGLGKTRTAKAIVRSFFEADMNVLWLVDTDDLVLQAKEALAGDPGPMPVDIEKAHKKAETWSPLVVASVHTLRNNKRLRRFDSSHFQLIIADEAHKSVTPGWQRIFDYFASAKILGLTATPDRTDCKSLLQIYEDVPFEMEIRTAINEGWLVPLRQSFVKVEGLDYSEVRRQAMKLREGDMEAALMSAEMIEQMTVPFVNEIDQRQALAFTCSVDHAYAVRDYLRRLGVVAETVEGDKTRLPSKRRQELIASYKRGEIQVLTNCAALTTGFDAPRTSAVGFMRPMISRALYAQCAGRGTRPVIPMRLNELMHEDAILRRQAIADSEKADCLLIDFLGNAGRLKLVRAASSMDPNIDEETAELAEKVAKERQLTMHQALDVAEEMRAALLEQINSREVNRDHSYEVVEIDPFNGSKCQRVFRLLGVTRKSKQWTSTRTPATDAQIDTLKLHKIPDPHVLSRDDAAKLIAELAWRRQHQLASPRQVELLVNVGRLPADQVRRLSAERAARGITQLKANKWKRPESWDRPKHERPGA